jgi:transcription elongation factor GreA
VWVTMKTYGITREGYEKLKKDLQRLKGVERAKILKEIERARAHGDISENAEYEAAKHAQGLLEARISDLESKFARSRVVDEDEMDADTVLLGAVVRVKDLNRNKKLRYTIVSDVEADFKSGKISNSSPVGRGLLGAKVGHTVEIDVPAGKLRYEVLEISR